MKFDDSQNTPPDYALTVGTGTPGEKAIIFNNGNPMNLITNHTNVRYISLPDDNGVLSLRDNLITPNVCRISSDFFQNAGDFGSSVSGGSILFTLADPGGRPGVVRLNSGSTATSHAKIGLSPSTSNVRFGFSLWNLSCAFKLNQLSNSTDSYTFLVGFLDATPTPIDGVFIRYTHSVNGGKYQFVCRSNNVETAIDTGVTANITDWVSIKIGVPANLGYADYSISGNGGSITPASNIPFGAGRETSAGVVIVNTLGTSATRSVDVDYLEVVTSFPNPR